MKPLRIAGMLTQTSKLGGCGEASISNYVGKPQDKDGYKY